VAGWRDLFIMEPLTREQLLRSAADDELSEEQLRALEDDLAEHPEDELILENERSLRGAVKRIMYGEVVIPSGLRERVIEIWKQSQEQDNTPIPVRRRPWFIPSGLAAGILLLVGASVLISVWSNHLVDQSETGRLTPSAKAAIDMYNRALAGRDLIENSAPGTEWLAQTDDAAEAVLAERFGPERGFVPDLREHGYHFMGLRVGKQIAGSVCLVYEQFGSSTGESSDSATKRQENRLIVLWMTKPADIDSNLLRQLQEGKGYRLTSGITPEGATQPLNGCFAWRFDNLVMILRIDHGVKPTDENTARAMAYTLGMPIGPVTTIP